MKNTTKTKKAAAKAAAPKKAAKPAKTESTDLAIHINPSGRICFGKAAAERIGELGFMAVSQTDHTLRLQATAKETDTAIRRANGRPYITATQELKASGLFSGKAVDLIAKPVNGHGFELTAR
ncbi:MAG TPA: hypothetical protein VH639_24405 [Bryobacteraceae bacterium]|jgi:hypothetical protein